MLTLPRQPRRARVRAFSLVIGAAGGGLAAPAAAVVGWPPAPTAAAATMGLLLLALGQPRLARLAYRAWARATHAYARLAAEALVSLWYPLVFGAVRLGGSALELRRGDLVRSRWRPRRTIGSDAYESLDERPARDRGGWLRRYLAWAWRSGHAWAVAVLPLLLLLAALESGAEPEDVPAGIYTLF